jgi:hypothetical protein
MFMGQWRPQFLNLSSQNDIIEDLGVIPHSPFHVYQECNLAFRMSAHHFNETI